MKKMLVAATAAALVVSGCGMNDDDNMVGVCMNQQNVRVDDSYCNGDGSNMAGFFWGYLFATSFMPRVGSPVTDFSRTVDTGRYNVYRGGVPKSGGNLNFQTYKPKSSTITNKSNSLNSSKWKTYDSKGNSKSGWGSGGSSKFNSGTKSGGGYKAPGGFSGGSRSFGGKR